MIILDSCGNPINPETDPDEYFEAIRPFQEIEKKDRFFGPCEDDCQVTAIAIEESERFERGMLKDCEEAIFREYLRTGKIPTGMYPSILFDGPEGLPCGGLLANKR